MKINLLKKSVLFVTFFFSFAFVSCNTEDNFTNVTESKSPASFTERLANSDKIRTEDMVVFRTKLQEALQEGQQGNKQQYEDMLLQAATEYLDYNKIAYDKSENISTVFSKALSLYSERMTKLNSPKN